MKRSNSVALMLGLTLTLFVHHVRALDVRASLDDIRQSEKTPGLLLMDVPLNRTENSTVVGVRKYGEAIVMQEQDSLHLGSLTKAMTATLIAKLIESGNLTWNSTVQDVFTGSGFQIDSAYRTITIEMLCSHYSGLTNDMLLGDPDFFNGLRAQDDPVKGRAEYLTRALCAPPDHAADEYLYSNINYIILGHMVDRLFGPWESVIRSQLFDIIAMKDCGFGPAPESSLNSVENPWPHNVSSDGQPQPTSSDLDNPPLVGPAGTVHCTASSYAKFLQLHLRALTDPRGNETSFLSPETWKRLHNPHSSNFEESTLYTPGGWIFEQGSDNGTVLWHTGSNSLNYANVYLAKGNGRAVFSFANVGPPNGLRATNKAIDSYLTSNGIKPSTNGATKPTDSLLMYLVLLLVLLMWW